MPITNFKCDFCEQVKQYVTEYYEASSVSSVKIMMHPLNRQFVGYHKFICDDCLNEKGNT